MADSRIDIGIKRPSSSPNNVSKTSTSWPVKPFESNNPSPRSLEIRFYNLSTKRKSPGSSQFIISPIFENTTWDQTYTLENPPGSTEDYTNDNDNYQSTRIPTPYEYRTEFRESNSKRFDRESLRRITDEELEENEDVYPVGVRTPAIRCYVKTPDGGTVDMVDYLSIKNGECRGQLKEMEDDDGNNALCYRWGQAPLTQMHLKIEEIISGVSYDRCSAYGRTEETISQGHVTYGDTIECWGAYWQDCLDGLFYPAWNTADTDSIKITKVPEYDCDKDNVVTDTPVRLTALQNRLSIYLVPRKWFGVADYRYRADTRNLYHKRYGVFIMPPNDFTMPPARTAGRTELSRVYVRDYDTPPEYDHVFQDWEGDSAERNRFHIFCHIPWSTFYGYTLDAQIRNCGHYDNLGAQCAPGLDPYYNSPGSMTWDWTNYTARIDFSSGYILPAESGIRYFGRISSMPDGKVSHANSKIILPESDPGIGGANWRVGYVYGVNKYDTDFWTPEKCDALESIKSEVFSHSLMAAPPSSPYKMDAWTCCACGWGEKELIAVIVNENSGEELYVWAKDGKVERLNDRMWSTDAGLRDQLAVDGVIAVNFDRTWSWCGNYLGFHTVNLDGFMSPNWGLEPKKAQFSQLAFRQWAGGALIYRIPDPINGGSTLHAENHSTADLPIGDEFEWLTPPFEEDGLYLGCFAVPFIIQNSQRDSSEWYKN